jgi:chorismate mutase
MPLTALAALRAEIDTIDEEIIQLLARRFSATEQVGELKAQHQLTAVDPEREAAQARRYHMLADAHQLNPALVMSLFAAVIQEVVANHQKLATQAHDRK